jgi:hypothetical protein
MEKLSFKRRLQVLEEYLVNWKIPEEPFAHQDAGRLRKMKEGDSWLTSPENK